MKDEAAKLGAPKLDGLSLMFGTTKINVNYTLVDALKQKYACTATFFAKKGDGFIRVSTNVVKDDGSRAVGTMLDPKGPAFAAISKDEAYYGIVDILRARNMRQVTSQSKMKQAKSSEFTTSASK